MKITKLSSPFVMVIFGATGDLARFKLIPALLELYNRDQLPENFYLYGFARRDLSIESFRNLFSHLSEKEGWEDFVSHFQYQQGKFEEEQGYKELIQKLQDIDDEVGACVSRLFYLATPPEMYNNILNKLHQTKLSDGCGHEENKWTKIIIEKPFGNDMEHARELDRKLGEIFQEEQIYRVDHYLGKDTVQNIIAFRFANGIFDPIWNSTYLDHVQITISEKNGISGRGRFFDGVGNLRDVAQNHLLQLVTAVAMEQPISFTKEGVREARAQAMKAIRLIQPDDVAASVVRGQYRSYREEDHVANGSTTETFVAMKLFVDSQRFEDIPFYVRAGKKMKDDFVEISLVFKQTCHVLFREYGCPEIGNVLTFRIQPDEGISLRMIAKKPGPKLSLGDVKMHFTYKDSYGRRGIDAYEKILLDIFTGDQMLFNRSDELESSWQLISQIMEGFTKKDVPLHLYEDNSTGPEEGNKLITNDGREWL